MVTTSGRSEVRRSAVVGSVAALAMVALAALLVALGRPVLFVVSDPAASSGKGPTWGAVTVVGVVLWGCAAAVAAFGASGCRDRTLRGHLVGVAVLSTWLALDDQFLLHEALGRVAPVSAKLGILPTLALALVVVLQGRAARRAHGGAGHLLAALVALGGSVAIDAVHLARGLLGVPAVAVDYAEETCKLTGIVLWLLYALHLAGRARPAVG